MGSRGGKNLTPKFLAYLSPQLSQKANKINFGNRNGKNDIPHQTTGGIGRRVSTTIRGPPYTTRKKFPVFSQCLKAK